MMAQLLGIFAGIAALVLLFKPFFGDFGGFGDCLKFWLTPDIISLFRGEFYEDWWAGTKLGVWLLLGTGSGLAVYHGINHLLS